jgi:hypothetical protein
MIFRIVFSLNQARCCEAEAPRFMRLVLGGTMGDADNYTSAITKWRADIGQGILRTD